VSQNSKSDPTLTTNGHQHIFPHQELEDIVGEEIEDQEQLVGLATAIMLLGAIEACRLHAERRKPSRLFLFRPQLLPNPRVMMPLQVLYSTQNDPAFARHPTSPLWAARRWGGIERWMRKEGGVEQTWK
jgi:hypothetical protein